MRRDGFDPHLTLYKPTGDTMSTLSNNMKSYVKSYLARSQASADHDIAFESEKWMQQIPYITFPQGWEIRVIPSFGCAVVRFMVKKGNREISVFLDCYRMLGAWDRPYWEIYPGPNERGEPERIAMEDVEELIYQISQSFIQMGDTPSPHDPPKPTAERKPLKRFNRFEHIDIVQRDENNDEIYTDGEPDQSS